MPGTALSWALPCVPYAGQEVGFFALPPPGAMVWIEFEGGDPSLPIWTGCFWQEGQLSWPPLPTVKILKTRAITLMLDDTPGEGGLTAIVQPPAVEVPVTLRLGATGITLETGGALFHLGPEALNAVVEDGTLTLTAEEATLGVAAAQIILTPETVTVEAPPSTVVVGPEGVTLACPPGEVSVTEAMVSVSSAEAALELSAELISMSCAAASQTMLAEGLVTLASGASTHTLLAEGLVSMQAGGASVVLAEEPVIINEGALEVI